MWPKPRGHKERVGPFQKSDCIYHTRDCISATVGTGVLLNDSVLLATLPIFSTAFCSGSAISQLICRLFFFLRKPSACLSPRMECQCYSCFLLVQSLITPLATFSDMPRTGSGPVSGCEEPCLANSTATSCPSIPTCPGTHTSSILLCSASFTRD